MTVTITGTEVDRASSWLGPDFDDLYIYFTNSYSYISSSQINAIEGFVELRNPFGDVVDRLSFSHLHPVAAGASAVDPYLSVSFKRYECDFSSWKEWCQAFNADFSNLTLDTVVERVALADGRVISSRSSRRNSASSPRPGLRRRISGVPVPFLVGLGYAQGGCLRACRRPVER